MGLPLRRDRGLAAGGCHPAQDPRLGRRLRRRGGEGLLKRIASQLRATLVRADRLLLLIVIAGLVFRLAGLGYVRHGYDDSYQMYLALRLLDGREWLLLGQPSSIFLDNPPLMAYLQALPLLVWRSPWSVYGLIAFLNGLGTWFVHGAIAPLLGRRAGLAAAFLFAFNPWIVFFSQRPWAQGLLPLLMAVLAWGVWPTLVTGQPRLRPFLIGLLALAAMTQMYVVAFALVVPVGLLLLLHRSQVPRRPLLVGASVFLLSLALYGLALRAATAENFAKLENFAGDRSIAFSMEPLEHTLRLVTGLEYESREAPAAVPAAFAAAMRAGHYLLAAALAAGVLQAVLARRDRGSHRRLGGLLLVWFGAVALGVALVPYPAHPHYLLLTLPAGQALAAWGLRPLLDGSRLARLLVLALVGIAILFVFADIRARRAVAQTPGGMRLEDRPLLDAARAGKAIRALVADASPPRRALAGDHAAVLSSASATYLERVGDLDYPDFTLVPSEESMLYVLIGPQAGGRERPPWLRPSASRTLTLLDGAPLALHLVAPVTLSEALALPETAVERATPAGVTLLGFDAPSTLALAPGSAITLTTYWRVDDLPPGREGWFVAAYYQVLNQASQIEANVTGRGQWGYRWRLGDVYVETASVPLPDTLARGDYRLIFGLFDPIHGLSFPFDVAGDDAPFESLPVVVGR